MRHKLNAISLYDYKCGLGESLTKALDAVSEIQSYLVSPNYEILGVDEKRESTSNMIRNLIEMHSDILSQVLTEYNSVHCLEDEDTESEECCGNDDEVVSTDDGISTSDFTSTSTNNNLTFDIQKKG